MIHTANACVTLSGSVVVRGAIISKYFTASGNAGVYFDDSFDADIPGFDNNGGADKMKVIGWIQQLLNLFPLPYTIRISLVKVVVE